MEAAAGGLAIVGACTVAGAVAVPVALGATGFSAIGPVAGTIASWGIGGAGGGALWAWSVAQSVAMTTGLSTVVGAAGGAVVGVVGGVVAFFV